MNYKLNRQRENIMEMTQFNEIFTHVAVEQTDDENIGRKFKYTTVESSDGLVHREGVFQIIGTQKDYKGDFCYRVKMIEYKGEAFEDNFGSVFNPKRPVEYIS